MLRKDVKLGFAIGGIMLAVVIVYVLVVPGDKKSVGIVTDDSQTSGKPDGSSPSAPPAEPEQADKSNAPPAVPAKVDADQGPTTAPAVPPSSTAGNTTSSGPDWNKLLAEGSSSPTMMSETPTLDTKHPAAAPDATPTAAMASPDQPAADTAAASAIDKATPDLAIDTTSTPATQPAEAGQRIHVVQSGEMLTSIAAAAYGDSRKWKKIAAANPDVNPNRLTVGTKLVIPDLKNAKESSPSSTGGDAAGAAVLAAANIDSQTQYQVQPNDSLYRISMKLYGKADHVDKLYEANKDVIGPDPKRLKLNMVLKLTDPPTSASIAASR